MQHPLRARFRLRIPARGVEVEVLAPRTEEILRATDIVGRHAEAAAWADHAALFVEAAAVLHPLIARVWHDGVEVQDFAEHLEDLTAGAQAIEVLRTACFRPADPVDAVDSE